MNAPQAGIFALGTAAHAYLELDESPTARGLELVAEVASLREPRTTMGGVNLVAGFRPELWREAAPVDAPTDLVGFETDLVGVDGYVMPATQHDAVLWISGSAYDVVFEVARAALTVLRNVASVAEETSSWVPVPASRGPLARIDRRHEVCKGRGSSSPRRRYATHRGSTLSTHEPPNGGRHGNSRDRS